MSDPQKRPYDNHGQFVPLECPRAQCGAGHLVHEGDGVWACDGLADPENDDKELECCSHMHIDGKPYA